MVTEPAVSVIMSVFNGQPFLSPAVESILRQTLRDFEFVIIDDGSTDGTSLILDGYHQRDSRVIVYHQRNQGRAAALNTACRIAKASYLARMDPDDIAFPDRLERQMNALADSEVAVIGGAIVLINRNGAGFGKLEYPTQDAQIKSIITQDNPFAHPAIVMRKDAFDAAGGYRELFVPTEDYDLWLRIAEHYKLANLPEPVLYYRVHSSQDSFQKIEQQVLCMLGAQISARYRRESGKDPFDQVERVTSEVLVQLGASAAEIEKRVLEGYCARARIMFEASEPQSALSVLDKTVRVIRMGNSSSSLIDTIPSTVLTWANRLYSQRCYAQARDCLLFASRVQPSLIADTRFFRLVTKLLLGEQATERVKRTIRALTYRMESKTE